ncbi:UPF0489 protein C5orf22 homolog [Saccostrea echinata]|uniref:UPF0489 protein C5orf22 homolog n=1 Tax=Saccostrea echinata TaxID=191078 RepID=UPI002A831607|nr:UPF0489 protein C5orf22 homolog [Saccostrea echinata]
MSRRVCLGFKLRCVSYLCISCILTVMILLTIYVNNSPNNREILSGNLIEEKSSSIDVFVVEEHHEVIPYWFGNSAGNLKEKKGLTLIHIDGHSDMALPQYFRKLPFLRWPKNRKELDYYMQENDMFILSAVLSGMFSKVVWVWPRWDQENHENSSHDVYLAKIGWLMVDTSIPKMKRKALCVCYQSLNSNRTSTKSDKKVDCRRLPTSLEDDDDFDEGVEIDPKTCRTEITFSYEEVREDLAADIFRREANKYKENGVILDIDEDFFACTYASRPLLNAGLTEKELESINDIVSGTFCPNNAKEETEADRVLTELLDDIMSSGCFGKEIQGGGACQNKEASIRDKCLHILNNKKEHLMCDKSFYKGWNKEKQLKMLVHLIMGMAKAQILAIKYVGFCFTTIKSRGLDVTKSSEFYLCMGANSPNNSMVIEHTTTLLEINQRTEDLQDIFAALKPRLVPSMITLCRSSRDGYVPRELQNHIENSIIKSLASSFPTKLNYDVELLGGKDGWLKSRNIL